METSINELRREELVERFLHADHKTIGWYLDACDTMQAVDEVKQIFWIGIIDLEEFVKEKEAGEVAHVVFFSNGVGGTVPDCAIEVLVQDENVDEKAMLCFPYDLSLIEADLLDARKIGMKYFNLYLRETVDCKGEHRVTMLFHNRKKQKPLYGTATRDYWFDMPPEKFVPLMEAVLEDPIVEEDIYFAFDFNTQHELNKKKGVSEYDALESEDTEGGETQTDESAN